MNNKTKAIAIGLYLFALLVAALISEAAFAPVAIGGLVIFFVVHLTLRATQRPPTR
jgi:hypothetical protein